MRHLLGRVAISVCALALSLQSASAIPVPHPRPALDIVARSAFIPVPTPRPAKPGVIVLADVPVPKPRPELDSDATADDADAAAIDPPAFENSAPDLSGDGAPRIETADHRLFCVEYARERSGLEIQGDAKTWWVHAAGIYDRSAAPSQGAVMVFAATRTMIRGHVAVVTRIVSDREIVVDHANWMRDGKIYLNMPVADVSPNNDWSLVRVWDARDGQWGGRVYPIRGFVSRRATAQS
jgi:hypothetical protein